MTAVNYAKIIKDTFSQCVTLDDFIYLTDPLLLSALTDMEVSVDAFELLLHIHDEMKLYF